MKNVLLKLAKNPLLLFGLLFASTAVFASPVAYDFRTATTMPTDFVTIYTNAMTSIALLTGGGTTLTAVKASVGLVSGLIRSMFSA